jgi:hypothetical protein
MMHDLTHEMKKGEKNVREYLAAIGRRGGVTSRPELTRSHAKWMVVIREAKRAALKASVGRAANITAGRGHALGGRPGTEMGSRKGVAAAQSQIVKTHLT